MTLRRTFIELYLEDPARDAAALGALLDLSVLERLPSFFELSNEGSLILLSGLSDTPSFLSSVSTTSGNGRIEICFEMEDVDAAWLRVSDCPYEVVEELIDRPWGKRDFRLVGPGDYYFRITSAEDPAKRLEGQ